MYVNIKASKNTANSILRKCWKLNEGATELKALPSGVSTYNILVTYDVKEEKDFTINIKGDSVKIDLSGNTYYNIQDINGWYAMVLKDKVSTENITTKTNRLINQALSIPLPGKSTMWYEGNESKGTVSCETWASSHGITSEGDAQLLWSFHSPYNDPYDIQIKNKAVCDMGHNDFVLTDYDYRAPLESKYSNAASPSKWPSGKVEGLDYISDKDLTSTIWQDNRIYVINPNKVEKTDGFRIFKFAFLQGEAPNTFRIAEASICDMYQSSRYPGVRLFGLCNYLIDQDSDISNDMTDVDGNPNTYRYAQEKVGGAIINGQSVPNNNNSTKYYMYNDLYTVTLTPTFSGDITFHLIDLKGKELMNVKVPSSSIPLESLPEVMKSPQAKN